MSDEKKLRPPQHQSHQPGKESEMKPLPQSIDEHYKGSNKLKDKVAIITGGDSGIGRAIALHFATEGAHIVFSYYDEHEDARTTKELVEALGVKCITLNGDIGDPSFCKSIVDETINKFKKIDILINNTAEQHPQDNFTDITNEQLERTFRTNVFSYFYMVKEALPHMKEGSNIINTASITAYQGRGDLVDYSATKGAIVTFTRSLSENLLKKGIRVNAVAPGPIWTPLIPASFRADQVAVFGSDTPMKRAGEPKEVAPCYVFLASKDAAYISGQVIHPNGGNVVNG